MDYGCALSALALAPSGIFNNALPTPFFVMPAPLFVIPAFAEMTGKIDDIHIRQQHNALLMTPPSVGTEAGTRETIVRPTVFIIRRAGLCAGLTTPGHYLIHRIPGFALHHENKNPATGFPAAGFYNSLTPEGATLISCLLL